MESTEGRTTSIPPPGKNKPKPFLKSTIENFDEEVIRISIYNFATNERERPTVKELHVKLFHHIVFPAVCQVCGVFQRCVFMMSTMALVAAE
jgi:hypothetical protein